MAICHLRQPTAFSSESLYGLPGHAPNIMNMKLILSCHLRLKWHTNRGRTPLWLSDPILVGSLLRLVLFLGLSCYIDFAFWAFQCTFSFNHPTIFILDFEWGIFHVNEVPRNAFGTDYFQIKQYQTGPTSLRAQLVCLICSPRNDFKECVTSLLRTTLQQYLKVFLVPCVTETILFVEYWGL